MNAFQKLEEYAASCFLFAIDERDGLQRIRGLEAREFGMEQDVRKGGQSFCAASSISCLALSFAAMKVAWSILNRRWSFFVI